MAIVSSDIKLKLSTKSGSAGNTTAGTPDASLGKYISTTEVSGTALNNIFDNVSGDENTASDVEYRCVFVHNSAAQTFLGAVVWLDTQTAGGADIAISVDTTAASAVGSSSAQAKEVADENTAPTSQTFSAPSTKGAGLSIGDLTAGQVRGIWIRRTATNSAAIDSDPFGLSIGGDTGA